MTQSKHTLGPIHYSKCRCGHPSCNQYTLSTQGSVGFEEADARLYAAAPDLLALVELVHGSFGGGNVITFSDADIAEFSAAIAKAKGDTK